MPGQGWLAQTSNILQPRLSPAPQNLGLNGSPN